VTGLRLRLLAALLASVVVALATVALVGRWATARELDRYVERNRYGLRSAADQLVDQRHNRVVLIDPEGNVLADTTGDLAGRRIDDPSIQQLVFSRELAYIERAQRSRSFPDDGTSFIRMLPPPDSGGIPGEEVFLSSVNTSLAVAVVVGVLVAVGLALFFSRRVLGRIDALTAAARQMERGDLSQRVAVGPRDEIGHLASAFNAMAESLSRTERLRRTMVSDVAHELRTPLTNVRGYLEALRDGVAEPTPALIQSLHEEAMLLGRLVEDLQELTLAEAGQLQLDRAPCALEDLLAPAVELARPRAAERGVTLRLDLPPELPPVEVDRARIAQVLRNLLANALTHTGPGGEVVLSAAAGDAAVELQVADTGSGIPPEHLPHVFERFYRADRSRARATGGTGIGLAIVKELIQAHGGRVEIRSHVGRGTVVVFTLPRLHSFFTPDWQARAGVHDPPRAAAHHP
jgi:signal transduction histidine kinase